jgi:hypothetical protein
MAYIGVVGSLDTTINSDFSKYTYEYIATAGQTVFTGLDANSASLGYSVGNILVSYGGADLAFSDYSATNGTSVVLSAGALAGKIIRVVAFQAFEVADTYTKAEVDVRTSYAKSVAIIADVKGYSSSGGTFIQDIWQTRELNTELDDPENIVTISSNQFTLLAGTYLIEWSTPAYKVERHTSRLQNITDSTTDGLGTSSFVGATEAATTTSSGSSIVTLSATKSFQIQHYCSAGVATYGFGVNSGIVNYNSIYTLVKIHKIGA